MLSKRFNTKKKNSIKDFFSKRDQIRRKIADLVTFTEVILNGKIHFLCSVSVPLLILNLISSDEFPALVAENFRRYFGKSFESSLYPRKARPYLLLK